MTSGVDVVAAGCRLSEVDERQEVIAQLTDLVALAETGGVSEGPSRSANCV